jgi:hypothetical protein
LQTATFGELHVSATALDFDDVPLEPLREATRGLFLEGSEGPFGPRLVGRLHLPQPVFTGLEPGGPCELAFAAGEACITNLRLSDALTYLPGLVDAGTTIPYFLNTMELRLEGVDLGPLPAVLPGATFELYFKDGPKLQRRRAYDRAGVRSSSVGLWFELEILAKAGDAPYDVTIGCNCFGADPPLFAALCDRWETGNYAFPWTAPPATVLDPVPGLCFAFPLLGVPMPESVQLGSFSVTARVNRLPVRVGLVPVRRGPLDQPSEAGAWLEGYPGGRDLRVSEMFDVEVVIGNELDVEATGDLAGSTADVALTTQLELFGANAALACELAGCEGIVGGFLRTLFEQELAGAIYGPNADGSATLADSFRELLTYDATLADFTSDFPCEGGGSCNENGGERLRLAVAATVSYVKWLWLASPFVPAGADYYYPMLEVRSNDPSLPDNHMVRGLATTADLLAGDDGEAVGLVFDFDEDPDQDGLVTGADPDWTCPASAQDADGDGLDDDCDPCPFSAENDADGDGLCAVGPGGVQTDNCPLAYNPTQANCNVDAERQLTPDQLWGDACDPVPCPEDLYVPVKEQSMQVVHQVCSVYDRDGKAGQGQESALLDLRALASHPKDASLLVEPESVLDVPTTTLFCQPKRRARHQLQETLRLRARGEGRRRQVRPRARELARCNVPEPRVGADPARRAPALVSPGLALRRGSEARLRRQRAGARRLHRRGRRAAQ